MGAWQKVWLNGSSAEGLGGSLRLHSLLIVLEHVFFGDFDGWIFVRVNMAGRGCQKRVLFLYIIQYTEMVYLSWFLSGLLFG